ncbi:MAG: sortase [Candidatus Paceibacterota bacterium]|jgi:LPXTG-site transpeptidase (sortase) family protein
MKGLITITARLILAGQRAYLKKWSFLCLFVFVFIANIAVLASLDLLPSVSTKVEASAPVVVNTITSTPAVPELPTKIEIAAINLSSTIANPATTDVSTLDEDLLKGAVRYPTSAKLGEDGNVVLFGHSSYLPVVLNQAYKTFNGIQKITAGDSVIVSSSGTAYTYRVKSVEKESANSNSAIPLLVTGKTLTLVTCNSFAEKTDRFVVVADFVESHPALP